MPTQSDLPVISLMLAVTDGPAAVEWYKRALGATVLWSLGSVAGLEIEGAPFFIGEPAHNGWESPLKLEPREVSTISGITRRHGASIDRDISSIRLGIFGWSATSLR